MTPDYTLLCLDLIAGDKHPSQGGGNVLIGSGFACQCAVPWHHAAHEGTVRWNPAQPTRLTMPAGITKARFSCGIAITANDIGDRQVYTRHNGSEYPLGYISEIRTAALSSSSGNSWFAQGAWMDVREGDYAELILFQTSGSDILLRALGSSWFQCEVSA